MKVFTVAEMVAAENSADLANHSYASMMEMAGRGVADAISARLPCERLPVTNQHILILVGPGNNGGDGLVAARHLAQAGATVVLYLTKARTASADQNFSSVIEIGLQLVYAADDPAFTILQSHVQQANIIIDALLGTGVTRPITGAVAGILSTVSKFRQSHLETPSLISLTGTNSVIEQSTMETVVVAVDCPSGANCDTGECDPLALSAEITITFAGPKRGHFLFPAAAHCGEFIVVDIGIADEHSAHITTEVATPASVAEMLPKRPLDGHKGTFGSVTVIGGSADYLGAPLLAATGALRAGAGVVSTIVPNDLRMMAATRLPESSYPAVPDADYLGLDSAEIILTHLTRFKNKKAALAIGPGLGANSDALLNTLFKSDNLLPLVIDADALNYLSRQTNWWQQLPPSSILTPHPVELGRLAGRDVRNENRFELAQTLAQQWQCTLVLKGAFTLIASPGAATTVIPLATPALAVGGSGDVLAGIIAALLAQGLLPHKAAITGTWLHAAAGQRLADTIGSSGNLASEIANQIPRVAQQLRMRT